MGQRPRGELGVGEGVAEPRLEFAEVRLGASLSSRRVSGPACNSRFQRTVHGQRQNCQAGAPSPTEKKMISARPIRFSAGT